MAARRPRIVVTRAPHQSSVLAEVLRALGAEPVFLPTIEIVEPESFAELDAALRTLAGFDWLVFTSANAVRIFTQRMPADAASLPIRVAAIGPATARALQDSGFAVTLVPSSAVAESLADALLPHAMHADGVAASFLLVRGSDGRDVVPDALRAAGASVTVATAYRTIVAPNAAQSVCELFPRGETEASVDAVTFTSSSSVRNFLALLDSAGGELPESVVLASIGPITSARLRDAGLRVHVEADEATTEALARAAIQALTRETA